MGFQISNIIVDTREKKELFLPSNNLSIVKLKLDEGDYTTKKLYNKHHIERKSGIDLYGSIIQNHQRFIKEIVRAKTKGLNLVIFVECTKKSFISKKFKGGYFLKTKPAVLAKIVSTIRTKYDIIFYWCENREDLKNKMVQWLNYKEQQETTEAQ